MDKRFIISPPFGTYFQPNWAAHVVGSYTAKPRPGRFKQILKTFRPTQGGWKNNIGLRNPGIDSAFTDITFSNPKRIYSYAGFSIEEWSYGWEKIPSWAQVEMNVGCPNAGVIIPSFKIFELYASKFNTTIVKLPCASSWMRTLDTAIDSGIEYVHLFNAVKLDDGYAHSGRAIRYEALRAVEKTKRRHPQIKVIGGGGIYTVDDARRMRNAGADILSLSTVLLRAPWNIPSIRNVMW